MAKYEYFNRDISWLSFNYRVLQEANDPSLPIYERLNFLAIYSNNLEEFYRVRVSYYRDLLRRANSIPQKIEKVQPAKIINKINSIVGKHQLEFTDIYRRIVPELKEEGVLLIDRREKLTLRQSKNAKAIFMNDILGAIQPVLLIKKNVRPFLKTGHVYLMLEMYTKRSRVSKSKQVAKYGMIKLPTDHNISRFIELQEYKGKYYIMFIDDIIMRHVHTIFPGYVINEWYSVKVTRDADMEYDEFEGEDLIEVIEHLESARSLGLPNRFQYDSYMPQRMLDYLVETFKIPQESLVKGRAVHNFKDFFSFPNPLSPKLENEKIVPLKVPELDGAGDIMDKMDDKEYLLHFPYQSYQYFIRFLNEAALDDRVTEIWATQYRVASNSAVVDALMNAALHGKKVTVFVELKARFDEEANLNYARDMRKAGIRIIYSLPGLKVHAKMVMVIRDNKKYAFLATGNFNEKTARLYGDHGLFTVDIRLTTEIEHLFKHLENQKYKLKLNHILVPNFNMVETYILLINQEIRNVKNGEEGYILLKMNGLQDKVLVDKLYEASEAGVKVDLLIRGVCVLVPNKKFSKNIRVVRIIDRFLEHARVFLFSNNGENILYMGSADWMKRNLYKRIECVFPIYNIHLKKEILDILNIQLKDNVKGRYVDENMHNKFRNDIKGEKIRSQIETTNYLKKKYGQGS
ncbi:polyphosphate kinase 1 [Bacteroidales bacterium]|nr:polyphosphate kinase 1 [Bacteroidales bacterium]